ncbi:hypothetical protein CVT24_011108 [Panaeolus cyanescens]|uniref:protein-histidine N-methyltransferase n=1 Tax=Panaeolus cyanescens TaxID=181874 RepID=A0A409YG52_9AGAR|nr:hypothetical protein CVT24_011108 [Panaeolus cyanescens]
MFKFNFDIDHDHELDEAVFGLPTEPEVLERKQDDVVSLTPCTEHALNELLDSIPPLISYSPIKIPLNESVSSVTLLRRDLFDARFQLIAEEGNEESPDQNPQSRLKQELKFVDAPSDLVPGVYEGGLKTWECSVDLASHLHSIPDAQNPANFLGQTILELGCGTAIPSLYVFKQVLAALNGTNKTKTELHLQDYNALVLQLVTLPNLILTWYTSSLADSYRSFIDDPEIAPVLDLNTPGELSITPDLKTAFSQSLASNNISLRFFSGSWDTFYPEKIAGSTGYDVLLTSETIYSPESLEPLLNLLQKICAPSPDKQATSLAALSLNDDGKGAHSQSHCICLVAAKVIYFGVGGGVEDFVKEVKNRGGNVETVLEHSVGVGRKVMRLSWD